MANRNNLNMTDYELQERPPVRFALNIFGHQSTVFFFFNVPSMITALVLIIILEYLEGTQNQNFSSTDLQN